MNTQDLIFRPFKIYCSQCRRLIEVSIESLDDNEDAVCQNCNFVNPTNINVDMLLKLIKQVENNSDNFDHIS